MAESDLQRFVTVHQQTYQIALNEIKNGKKSSHWMWFIFPQINGLGQSQISRSFSIKNLKEADDYLKHPVLGNHLIEITEAVLEIHGKTATEIFGAPDDLKLRSSMTLFAKLEDTNPIFMAVLNKYFDGMMDKRTLELI